MARMVRQAMMAAHSKRIDTIVRQVAEASLPATRRRLRVNTAAMSADELRGYVRARALSPVCVQTRQLTTARRWDDSRAKELVERALERTVHLIVRELSEPPILVMPVYEQPLRAAA